MSQLGAVAAGLGAVQPWLVVAAAVEAAAAVGAVDIVVDAGRLVVVDIVLGAVALGPSFGQLIESPPCCTVRPEKSKDSGHCFISFRPTVIHNRESINRHCAA